MKSTIKSVSSVRTKSLTADELVAGELYNYTLINDNGRTTKGVVLAVTHMDTYKIEIVELHGEDAGKLWGCAGHGIKFTPFEKELVLSK